MADFFDHLWLQMNNPRVNRDRAQYLARLRSLIQEAPPSCPLPRSNFPVLVESLDIENAVGQHARVLAFDREGFAAFEPARLREFKSTQQDFYVLRLDPLTDEAEVLESRAMGVDAYVIDMGKQDSASAQYLIEVGIDFSCDALALCRTEEELARVLTTHLQAHIFLSGELAAPQLLDLDLMKGRKVWVDLRSSLLDAELFKKPEFVQLMILPKTFHP